MSHFEKVIDLLEKSILVMSLAAPGVKGASREERLRLGVRYGSTKRKREWRKAARHLVDCGIPEIEERAKHLLALCEEYPAKGTGHAAVAFVLILLAAAAALLVWKFVL